ncbi:MAG: cell division protein FtsQ/DivIB [Candidatus Zipacnadales bacterium]
MSNSPSSVEQRKRLRQHRKRVALMVRYFIIGLLGALSGGFGLGVLVAGLRVTEVVIQCSDRSVAEEVQVNLTLPRWTNLVTSNLAHIARQAETCPRVKRAEFRRKFPHRLVLTLQPREPLLAWGKNGRYMVVDPEGVCLYWTDRPDPSLLRVKGVALKARVGQRLTGEWFERSRTVATALAQYDNFEPWTLDASLPPELSLVTAGGARGIVGTCPDLERRVRLFAEVITEYNRRGRSIGLVELRTDPPIVWEENSRPDRKLMTSA